MQQSVPLLTRHFVLVVEFVKLVYKYVSRRVRYNHEHDYYYSAWREPS